LKAVLLAAGRGQRLGTLTDHCPKPLLPIGVDSTLGLWMRELDIHGFDEILINAHYLADQIEDFVFSRKWISEVRVVREEHLLGTAGSVRSLLKGAVTDGAVVVHADNYFEGKIAPLIDSFRDRPVGIEICMYTFICEDTSEVGVVEMDDSGIVRKFWEKIPNAPSHTANAAIFAISDQVIERLDGEVDFSAEVLPKYVGRILAVPIVGTVIDIGTPERLNRARLVAARQEHP